MKKRAFLIVLDSFGIGGAVDAKEFGDEGTDTLRTISRSDKFVCPNLEKLGIFNIDGNGYHKASAAPMADYARMHEKSRGKDTIVGHWEIAGVVSNAPMPTFPNGFPREFIERFEKAAGRKTICNLPYSGTKVLEDYGEEHLKTGALIVYTSGDSVFQIAAHESLVPVDELYKICAMARQMLTGDLAVGRVIARPFIGESAKDFKRTANRRDYALLPPQSTVLDELKSAGKDVISVGKINDIFGGQGVTKAHKTKSNADGMRIALELLDEAFDGLCFINLVDFDMLFGHRRNIDGYAQAAAEFDAFLSQFIAKMRDGDMLIITADHGCDPAYLKTTDHTRENVPLLIYPPKASRGENLGTLDGFDNVAKILREELLGG